ncbi:MAG: putative Ig domain-containing protein, partial [Sphingobacteriaceae bacterium]
AVVTYSAPSLPAGLSINSSTGVISGTPSAITATATYTVTATNTGGSTTFGVVITVNDKIPGDISYTTPNAYYINEAITNLTPTVATGGGAIVSYSISPSVLPAGLSFSTSTGVISGTPTALTSASNYTVTATNTGGTKSATFSISVIVRPPLNLVYSPSSASPQFGQTITPMIPSSTGGAVANYSISPALPAGISLNPTTGTITGFLTAFLATQQTYTITATNSSGSATANVTFYLNSAPTKINLSKANIYEGNNIADVIGTLSTVDPDLSDTHTYTLVSGPNNQDNARFAIVGNQLKANAVYNYDNQNVYLIRVKTTDQSNASFETDIVITISKKPVVTGTGYNATSGVTPASTSPSISKGFSSQLNVTGANIVSYSWSPSTGLSATNIANPVATPSQTTTYEVTVTNSYGSTTKVYFTVTVVEDYNINPTNLITPNGDGINDTFFVDNLSSYPSSVLTIFDNAGRVVFTSNNYQNNWDGTVNGTPLHEGTYYYIITFNSGAAPKKGFITLIRQSN